MYVNVIFVTLSLNTHVDDRYVFELEVTRCSFQERWNECGEAIAVIRKTVVDVMWCHLPTIGLLKQQLQPSNHEVCARMRPNSVRVFVLKAKNNIFMYMPEVLKEGVDTWVHTMRWHDVGGYVISKCRR